MNRQAELAQLYRNLRSGNYRGSDVDRFRELVAAEIRPAVNAAMPALVARAQRREAARRAAAAAGQRAGAAAARRILRR